MPKQAIAPTNAPKAIGPYSAGIRVGKLVYTAGQLGLDPATMEFVPGGVEEQTRQALTNLKAILEEAGASLEQVVKTTVFLQNMSDFAAMNGVYATFFSPTGEVPPPARSAVAVAALPKGGLVEIEAIAIIE